MTRGNQSTEFLKAVREGSGYIGFRTKAGEFNQRFCPSTESMIALIDGIKSDCDIWVSMGTFPNRTGTRKAKNVSKLCSFWLDIDAHEGSKYESITDIKHALDKFITDTCLPEPNVIHWTGYGLHAIWALNSALPTADWLPTAKKLQSLAVTLGLGIDPITADAARILRVPGTINFRDPDQPRPTLVNEIGELIDLGSFETKLDAAVIKYPSPEAHTERQSKRSNFVAEPTEHNISLVKAMLACIDPDPEDVGNRYRWMRVIWALASTGWDEIAYNLALNWSMSGDLFDQKDFDGVWDSYNPTWGAAR